VSSLLASRTRILAALDAGEVRIATSGRLSAPCVLIEPGDPWAEWARAPGRIYRWRLTAIGGRADSEGSLLELAELVDKIDAALLAPGASRSTQLPTWAMPTDTTLGGVAYASTVATIQDTS
jgi:hypothetical protein